MMETYQNESFVSHIEMTFILGSKSLLNSKKWLIYILLSLAPFIFSILSSDRLFSSADGIEAFIGVTMQLQFGFFYVFGVLLLALPFTSDEITDHVLDLYLIRPIHKEVIFFTRYAVLVLANTIINSFLVIFYYIYFMLIDKRDVFSSSDLNVLYGVLGFFIFANILYSALFLAIGFLGSKGFGIGVFVAIVELFFLNFLFLSDDALVPRTNLKIIANQFLGTNFPYNVKSNFITSLSNYGNALLYVFTVTAAFLVIGFFYFKYQDYN